MSDTSIITEPSEVASGWRAFFYVAAAFNLVVGLAAMLSPDATVDARIVGLLVLGFGFVYFLVARDPLRFAPVLWAGILGKVGVVALLAPQAFSESGEGFVAGALIGDALFAAGFLAFLLMVADGSDR